MALPGRQYPSLSSMHSDSSGSSMDIETRQREAALRAEIRVFYSQKGIYIHKRTFEKCLKEIKNWINMSVLVGYLMQHGLVNGPDEMNMIQSPYFGGPVKLQNLLHLTEQNGGKDGYFLLYKCFCESRQENPLGHGDVVEALERYATAHPTAPDWLEQSGETAPPSAVSSHWTIGTDGESQPGGQSLNSSSRDSIDGSVTVQQRSSNNYPPAVGESQPGGQSSNAVGQRDIRDDQAMGQQNLALPAVGESQSGGQSSNAVGQRNIRDVQAMGQQNLALPGAPRISTPPTHVGQPQVTTQPPSTVPYQSQQQTERNTIPPPRQTSSANPHPSRHPQAPSPTSCNQPSYSQPRSSGAVIISYPGGKMNYRALDSYLSSNKEGLYSQQNTSRGGASLPKVTERNKDELSSNLELLSTASSSTSTYPGLRSVDFCHRPEEETSGTFTDVDDSRFQGRERYTSQQEVSKDSNEPTFGPKIAGQTPVQSHDQVAQLHNQDKDSTGKIPSIKLSELPYKNFVTQFGDLFTDKFAVKDDIAEAVLSYESDHIQISEVSLGMKKVKIHDKYEVRPSLVVLFDFLPEKNEKEPQQSGAAVDIDAESRNIPPQADRAKLVKNIIEAVNARNLVPQSPQYVCEDDPHWLKLEFLPPDVFADLAFLGDNPIVKVENGKCTNPTSELVGSSAGSKSETTEPSSGGSKSKILLRRSSEIKLKAREPNEALKQNTSKEDTKVSKTNVIKKILRPGDEFDAETDPNVPPTERKYGGAVGLVMKFNVKSPCGKKSLLYGVTCLHCGIPFNAPCEAYNNLYSELDKRNMVDKRMSPEEKYISVCHGQGLIPDVVEKHLRNIIVYTHAESNEAQTTSAEVGSFRCGLYGHLSDTPVDHPSRTVSITKPRVGDPSVVDIALFSLDNDDCERNVCLPKTSAKSWEVCEAENFTSLFEKYEIENEQMYLLRTKYKPKMAISAHIVTAGEIRSRQGSTQNFIRLKLKAGGQNFASHGDSGSLLFLKDVMRRTDSPFEVPERVNVAVGILTRGKGYNFCGGYLQPSLDVCAFQLYLQQARKLQLSLTDGDQKRALDEYSSLCKAMENGKVTLKKRYKFTDLLECSYTPCLNESSSN